MFYLFVLISCFYFFKFSNLRKSYFNFFYFYKRVYKYFDFDFSYFFGKNDIQRNYNYFYFSPVGVFFCAPHPFFNFFGFNFCFFNLIQNKSVFTFAFPVDYYTFGFFFIFFYPNYKIFNVSNVYFIYLLFHEEVAERSKATVCKTVLRAHGFESRPPHGLSLIHIIIVYFTMNQIHYSKLSTTHPFHLVTPSPWPITIAFCVFLTILAFIASIHSFLPSPFGIFSFISALSLVLFVMFIWWADVIQESFQGHHTEPVAKGLRLGFILFILSEVMFFFSFFWGFFYLALSPSIYIGCQWPPFGITTINPWGFPLLNTLFLLTSGVTVTYAHRAVLQNDFEVAQQGLYNTMRCAYSFMAIQFFEYLLAPFNISDSAFGSTFFMLTGFHGFHVLIGSIYLRICQFRHTRMQFTPDRHIGLETAIWYWHFVDVVWLFLFAIVYVWGGHKPY